MLFRRRLLGLSVVSLLVAGCGGGSSSSDDTPDPVPTSALSGLAAVGAPITDATLTANCSDGSGFTTTVTTNSNGAWSGEVASAALPCVLRVSGGTPPVTLYGYAASAGVANITPLTDLALALANGAPAGDWFATPAAWPSSGDITDSAADLLADLDVAGFSLPGAGFNLFSTPFTAIAGNPYDDLLEALATAIADDPALDDFDALRAALIAGGSLPAAPGDDGGGDDGGGDDGGGDDGGGDDGGGDDGGDGINYSALNDRNGFAVRLNGTGGTVLLEGAENSAASGSKRTFRFGYQTDWPYYDTVNLFNGSFVFSARLQVEQAPGLYTCASGDVGDLRISLANADSSSPWRGEFTATACEVEVEYGTARGGIAGQVRSATLSNVAGTHSFTLANAPFRVYQHRGTAGEPPALGANGYASLYIEEPGVFEFPGDQHFILDNAPTAMYGTSPDDGTIPFTGNASDRITLRNLVAGSTACPTNVALTAGRYLQELFYRNNVAGASCTRTLGGSAGSYSWGTYSATLIASTGDTNAGLTEEQRTVRIRGEIRNFMLNPLNAGNDGDEGALGDGNGVDMTVSDGVVHFPTNHRYRFEADGIRVQLQAYTWDIQPLYDIFAERTVKAATWGVNLRRVPQEVGTFACNSIANGYPRVVLSSGQNVAYSTTTANNTTPAVGASCSITVNSVTPEITGTYTATLIGHDGTATILPGGDNSATISGSFRFPAP